MDYFSRTFPADKIVNERTFGWESTVFWKHRREAGVPGVETLKKIVVKVEMVTGEGVEIR